MTSAEGFLSLLLQGPLSFFFAACLEKLLGAMTLRDIQIEAGKQHYMPFGIAVGLAPAFYPRHSSVRTHDAERINPVVPRWSAKDLVQDA
jgi:hypothetical protein